MPKLTPGRNGKPFELVEVRMMRPQMFVRSYVERTNLEALDVPSGVAGVRHFEQVSH